ncbi:MAG: methyltransferase domain-containing protein [Actinophytocola sp.]|nr:methyltransferase domain-containing protein [Actinophytocola sp.]
MSKYVYSFDPDAQNNTAAAVYRFARTGGKRVLDIGSGPGIVSRVLAHDDGRDVTCIDADSEALAEARDAGLTKTFEVDLLKPGWASVLPDKPYDVVILADVLEHLVRPQDLLTTLRQEEIVADDGMLVVSVPNVAHESLIAELLGGHFSYTAAGLLDETHLRWFTRDSITALLESTGHLVTHVHRTLRTTSQTPQSHRVIELPEAVWDALGALGEDARTYQYVMIVRPSSAAGQLAAMRHQLDQERREMSKRLRAARKKAKGLDERLAHERRSHEAAEAKLQALRGSKTYRAGSAMRKLAHPVASAGSFIRGRPAR